MRAGIDFDKLKDILAPALAEGQETYELRWVGKSKAMREAGQATTKTLRPDLDESVDFDQSENVFITGDNLEALKILQESYLGAIDMIYIDPPYNTGKDFVYKDNFRKTVAEQDEAEGNLDEEGNRLYKNEKTNPRYHSDWLNMMYPRLVLARNLLKDSGVIFISIDDNEQANLKAICDEIFGEGNFVSLFKWNKTSTPPSLSKKVRTKYEYILCFEKNRNELLYNGGKIDGGDAPLLNRGNSVKEVLFSKDYVSFNFNGSFKKGIYDRVELLDDIEISNGKSNVDFRLVGEFKWTQDTIDKECFELGTTYVIKSQKFSVRFQRTEEKSKRPTDIINFENNVGTNENANSELLNLLGEDIMSYPKPSSLIKYLIGFYENKEVTVLDFFAGSATTAHAVMQLNAEDGGNRKYILCTLDEKVADKSAAQQAGYATIDQISRERIRRAADKIRKEQPDKAKDLDLGFRAFRVDESNFRDVSVTPSEMVQGNLLESVDNIREDATALDLLFQVMLAWGSRLSLKISEQKLGDNTIYSVDEGSFIACFDDRITEETIRAIAQQKPQRAVFKDTSFTHSTDKINLTQIFKEVSPETQVKVV